jgi:hypothetical protein
MDFDPAPLDALERHFWRDIWDAAPGALADAHGVALRRFGPVQVTAIADLPNAGFMNLLLGASERGAVAGGRKMGVTGLEPVTSSLSSWRSPN